LTTSVVGARGAPWPLIQTLYVWTVMAGLLVQGTGSLLLDFNAGMRGAMPIPLATVMNGNLPHAWLHIVWGAGGLAWLLLFRSANARIVLGSVFGIFYTLLGFLGIAVHDPFGMRIELPENIFHLTVGPLMLLLTFLAAGSVRRPQHPSAR
jgi:hypothetical protein